MLLLLISICCLMAPSLYHQIVFDGESRAAAIKIATIMAVDLGYRVIIARDGTCSSSDETHDALLSLYQRRFEVQIELSDVAEIVETWHAEDR